MPNLPLLPARYDAGVVALSLLIAVYASYVALDLARRVRGPDRVAARAWAVGGALVMGSGIWSMHFVGMLAFELPGLATALGYRPGMTFFSWCAAVGVSALALAIAARERLTPTALTAGALAMGGGVCAMHYLGMAAIDLAPGIVWNAGWVAASALIAGGASAAALWIFFAVRRFTGLHARALQLGAAIVMGGAISGMHYAGMAAAGFPAGAVCLSADGLGGGSLGTAVVVAAVVLLSLTLATSVLDARLQARTVRLADRLEATNRQLEAANAELQRMAFLDPLTGVPNLARFDDRLAHALAHAKRRPGARVAVLFIDLDGFKPVNDSCGHAVGDALLRQVAGRLHALCRATDTLARVGGDEFVVLLEDLPDAARAEAFARRALQALKQPFAVEGRELRVGASIGVAVHPDHGDGARLKSMADAAMYAAKRQGGNRALAYDTRRDAATEPVDLLQDLHAAVERRQLLLHYQPKVDSASGRIRGVEALLRWSHPTRGLIAPATFVPMAERHGLIVPIGYWVIDEACRQIAVWRDQGRRIPVAVNLSAWQVRQADLVERIAGSLARHGVAPELLVCEITESAAMENLPAAQRVIDALARLGVRTAFDDFGTGHSSLAMLRLLAVHTLKVDRLFVSDVATDPKARELVEAVVRLAHALGMTVVAEGVETAAQRDALVALGCDELQGFHFARPMAAAELLLDSAPAVAAAFSPSTYVDLPA